MARVSQPRAPVMPRIRCAICDRPVDRVSMSYSYLSRCATIIVHCHGAEDQMQIPDYLAFEVADLDRQIFSQEGVAFRNVPNARIK